MPSAVKLSDSKYLHVCLTILDLTAGGDLSLGHCTGLASPLDCLAGQRLAPRTLLREIHSALQAQVLVLRVLPAERFCN